MYLYIWERIEMDEEEWRRMEKDGERWRRMERRMERRIYKDG